jgi:predicted  nucleic acid-binding Zn-ribbon protein
MSYFITDKHIIEHIVDSCEHNALLEVKKMRDDFNDLAHQFEKCREEVRDLQYEISHVRDMFSELSEILGAI